MAIQTIPSSGLWGYIAGLLNSNFAIIPVTAYCDYSTAPNLLLTTTPTILTGWAEETSPVGISEALGEITIASEGIYNVIIERSYLNTDNNPSDLVTVTIAVESDDQQGGGWVTIFSREVPIPSATGNDEPATLAFTTPANRPITAGTKFRVMVSAQDDGANPQETYLSRSKIVANLIHPLP